MYHCIIPIVSCTLFLFASLTWKEVYMFLPLEYLSFYYTNYGSHSAVVSRSDRDSDKRGHTKAHSQEIGIKQNNVTDMSLFSKIQTTLPSSKFSTTPKFIINNVLQYSLLSILPSKEEPQAVFQYNPNWWSDFEKKRTRFFKENTWKDPEAISSYLEKYDDNYTYYYRKIDYDGGFAYIYGKNICYDRKKYQYIFFDRRRRIPFSNTAAFQYGWKGTSVDRPLNRSNCYWEEKESYITQPYTIHHIYHFVESINFLWTKMDDINNFPVMRKLYLPRFNPNTDYQWASDYITVLKEAFGPGYNLQIINHPDVNSINSRYICFRRVLLLDRSHYNGDGGSVTGWEPVDFLRSMFYKHSNITIRTLTMNDVFQMVVIQRTGPRRFADVTNMVTMINTRIHGVHANFTYTSGSLANQVSIFANADIVLSPHGAGQTNILFMRPRTAFIEAFPPYFMEPTFMNLAGIARLQYFSITTYNETYLDKHAKSGSGQRIYENGLAFIKRKHFIKTLIDPSIFQLLSTVDDAVEYLKSYRCKHSEHEFNYIF